MSATQRYPAVRKIAQPLPTQITLADALKSLLAVEKTPESPFVVLNGAVATDLAGYASPSSSHGAFHAKATGRIIGLPGL
jgi:hypothetical protein